MATAVALRDNLLPLNGPIGSLDQYMAAASAIPALTAEEEYELATRLRGNNDLDAAQKLVISHLRFVAHRPKLSGLRSTYQRSDSGR